MEDAKVNKMKFTFEGQCCIGIGFLSSSWESSVAAPYMNGKQPSKFLVSMHGDVNMTM